MTVGADRRSVLTGLGALGVVGCSQASEPSSTASSVRKYGEPFDLSALERRHGGRLGFVASDGARLRILAWRGDERFVYCSTFKMYLAAATLVRIQDGSETADRMIPITQADMVSHAPVTGPAVGSGLTVARLMQAVVEVSDNPAANLLLRANGGIDAMRNFYRSLGDQSTTVDRYEPEMNRLDGDKDTITPIQSLANMQQILLDNGSPLSEESKAQLLDWMFASPTGTDRIKAGVPVGWSVAHKTGTGGYGPTNDIGLAYPPSGAPVVITAYFHATSASSAAANDAVIADATRLALKALGYD